MFPRKEKIRMTPRYKKTLFAVLPFAGSLCVAPLASADRYSDYGSQSYSEYGSRSGRSESQMSQRDLRSFQDYLDSHQETAQQLYRNPDLLRDRHFVRKHDALNDWFESHSDAAQALQSDPQRYLERGGHAYQRGEDYQR